MHWLKKAVYGVFFTVSLFIVISMFDGSGLGLFSAEFLTLTGFALIIAMGIFEINLVTYG